MLTLIENGEVYAPEPRGRTPVLLLGGKIAKIGGIDRKQAESLGLSRRGCFVDMDAADQDLGKWVRRYLEKGGRPDRLTLSSDSDGNSPKNLFLKWRATIQEHKVPFEQALPFLTANTAKVLKLAGKGRLAPGQDADLVVLERDTLEIAEVIAGGKRMVRKKQLAEDEKFLEQSDREIELVGKK